MPINNDDRCETLTIDTANNSKFHLLMKFLISKDFLLALKISRISLSFQALLLWLDDIFFHLCFFF